MLSCARSLLYVPFSTIKLSSMNLLHISPSCYVHVLLFVVFGFMFLQYRVFLHINMCLLMIAIVLAILNAMTVVKLSPLAILLVGKLSYCLFKLKNHGNFALGMWVWLKLYAWKFWWVNFGHSTQASKGIFRINRYAALSHKFHLMLGHPHQHNPQNINGIW